MSFTRRVKGEDTLIINESGDIKSTNMYLSRKLKPVIENMGFDVVNLFVFNYFMEGQSGSFELCASLKHNDYIVFVCINLDDKATFKDDEKEDFRKKFNRHILEIEEAASNAKWIDSDFISLYLSNYFSYMVDYHMIKDYNSSEFFHESVFTNSKTTQDVLDKLYVLDFDIEYSKFLQTFSENKEEEEDSYSPLLSPEEIKNVVPDWSIEEAKKTILNEVEVNDLNIIRLDYPSDYCNVGALVSFKFEDYEFFTFHYYMTNEELFRYIGDSVSYFVKEFKHCKYENRVAEGFIEHLFYSREVYFEKSGLVNNFGEINKKELIESSRRPIDLFESFRV